MTTLPAAFRSRRVMALLNIAAVGLGLSSATAGVFGTLWHELALPTGLSTAGIGMLWAWLLRRPDKFRRTNIRLGWVLSVPLAALNAAIAAGMLAAKENHLPGFFAGAAVGATFGAILWIPGLLLTLLLFGLPISHAQRVAEQGLAGEERGEWTVGFAAFVISLAGLMLGTLGHSVIWPATVAGIAGAATSSAAAVLAFARGRRRKRFVADVEAGKVTGYRVDPSPEGKVLVRVMETKSYRVADFEEDVYQLDFEGEATRPLLRASTDE